MGRVLTFLQREAKEMAFVAAYFLASFTLVAAIKQLFLLEYDIEIPAMLKAAFAALVVAKVVVVMDKTGARRSFRSHVVAVRILFRSLVYSFVVALVFTAEKIFHGYRAVHDLRLGIEHALDAADLSRLLATVLCLFASFLGYCLLREIERKVGQRRVYEFLFTREDDDSSEDQPTGAPA